MYTEIPNRAAGSRATDVLKAPCGPQDGICEVCRRSTASMKKMRMCRACYLKNWIKRKPPCTFSGCKNPSYARGWCRCHYAQVASGRELHPLRNQVRDEPKLQMLEFNRERMQYELRIERDAYRCSVTVTAMLFHRREIARLEAALACMAGVRTLSVKGGA